MTNRMIILMESVRLMEEGILKGTGKTFTVTDENGNEKVLQEPEPIHTFAGWKNLGYSVKKGEHAVASFPIWAGKSIKVEEEDGTETEKPGKIFMRKAFWFTEAQVERAEIRAERIKAQKTALPAVPVAVPAAVGAGYGSWLS